MKTLATLILLPSFSIASSSLVSFPKMPSWTSRMLLSESCNLALENLSENEVFKLAKQTKLAETEAVMADADENCDISSSKVSCKFDSVDLPSNADHERACNGANGRLLPARVGLTCFMWDGAIAEIVTNDMECVPSNCTEAEYGDALDEIAEELKAVYEHALWPHVQWCSVNLEDEQITSSAGANSVLAASVLGTMALAFVI